MIIFEDVYKRYKTDHGFGKWVFNGVSLVIPMNVNVGVIGRNGAGKSTLLRLIADADQPTRGRIERHCRVSWIMGFAGGLLGSLTGRQNARFICRIHGHEDDIKDRLALIQEFSGLGDEFDEPTNTYSTGMQARLKFALSLAFDFDVYISDELTAVGDAAFKAKALEAFKSRIGKAGLIMVAHQENTLKEFCSAGIWVHDGNAHWFDKIDDALKAYHDSVGISSADNTNINAPDKTPIHRHQTTNQAKPGFDRKRKGNNSEKKSDPVSDDLTSRYLQILEQGRRGNPAVVDYDEGEKLIRFANESGMTLMRIGQIKKKGYRLKENVIPMLRHRQMKSPDSLVELYDIQSQCEKIEGDE